MSTTIPCGSPSSAATTFAVLRATPGSRISSSRRARHLAVELLEQHPHRPAQRLRLLAVEAGREDVALELLLRHGEVVLGLAVLLEQRLGDAVDVHVGRLRREHHRDEQLERAAEAERDRRVGVLDREPLDDRADPLLLRPDALARLPARSYEATASGSRGRRRGPAQTRSSAGQPAQAKSLGVGGNSPAWMPRDRGGQLGLELGHVGAREDGLHRRVRPLEEVVDDLDLLGAGAEARERVDEPLQPVVLPRRSPPATPRRAAFVL